MKLFSRIYGIGTPIIILHGLFGMSDNWNSIGKKLSQYFQVHLLDLRNHGRSPHHNKFNHDVMYRDLLLYIEDHNIKDPILLGHSLGGKVVMNFSFMYPEKVQKTIVVDISPRIYNVDFAQGLLERLYSIPLENFNQRKEIDNLLSFDYKDKSFRQFILKNLYRNENNKFAWRFNIDILLEQICNIKVADFVNGVCDVETHFIRGGNSNYITQEDEQTINKHFSNFSISTINGAGHWIHVEKPMEFYNVIMNFSKA